jgi:hypothetical protein
MSDDGTFDWKQAASGLELHRSALVFKVFVVIVAILYALVQIASKHGGAEPGAFTLMLGIAEICATIMALVGVARFTSNLPPEAGGLGMFAVVCLVGVVGVQLYALWVVWKVMEVVSSKHSSAIWDVMSHAERLPTVQLVGSIAGLFALLIVLGAIAGVGRILSVPALTGRARGLMFAVVTLAIAYGAILHWVQHARGLGVGEGLGALGLLAAFGIGVLVSYIGTLTWAASTMRQPPPPPPSELPPARVVES